jgi:hypothetical protein
MTAETGLRLTWRTTIIVAGIWTAECLVYALQQILYHAAAGETAPLGNIFYLGFKSAATWFPITLALIGLRVVPRLRDRPWSIILGVHLVLALVANGVDVGMDLLAGRLTGFLPLTGSVAASYFRQSTFNIFT